MLILALVMVMIVVCIPILHLYWSYTSRVLVEKGEKNDSNEEVERMMKYEWELMMAR